MPTSVRPRERLLTHGAEQLNDAELLAIILRTGSTSQNVIDLAHELLATFDGLDGVARASLPDLQKIKGMGVVKAIEIKASITLGQRVVALDPAQLPMIRSPEDVDALLGTKMRMLEHEQLNVLLLNQKNRLIRNHKVADGTLNQTTTRIAEMFKEAVRENAASVIVVHNHPSGDPSPSGEDVELTREARKAGELLQIEVLDHVVIGRGGLKPWRSLREMGLGFDMEKRRAS
ncbi:MAG TPA: DNA repair protein RadC [Chloroflexota bacterium]|nr:DNA repair protein RadC [Chloroflexota bacterium]